MTHSHLVIYLFFFFSVLVWTISKKPPYTALDSRTLFGGSSNKKKKERKEKEIKLKEKKNKQVTTPTHLVCA